MISVEELKELIERGREGPTLDYKRDLNLGDENRNSEFIKDVLALANMGDTAYIVTGVEDTTWKPVGITSSCTQAQLNQILKDRTDPPLRVEYEEKVLGGLTQGVVKIVGEDPPYIVMVKDRYGCLQKGTIYIRNNDINEGARRSDLDRMFSSSADFKLDVEITQVKSDDHKEVDIKIILTNIGKGEAEYPYLRMNFLNIKEIKKCSGGISDITAFNDSRHVIRSFPESILYPNIRWVCGHVNVIVDINVDVIKTLTEIRAKKVFKKFLYPIKL